MTRLQVTYRGMDSNNNNAFESVIMLEVREDIADEIIERTLKNFTTEISIIIDNCARLILNDNYAVGKVIEIEKI